MKWQGRGDEHNHDDIEDTFQYQSKYLETYVRLTNARCIVINEDFTKQMASGISALLFHFDSHNSDEITIYINSSGGDSTALHCIADTMKLISSPVSTVCLGKAYSAGAFLLASGAKGRRFALKHSEIMLHSVSCVFPLPNESSADQSKNYLNFITEVNDGVLGILAKNTKHTLKQVKEDCKQDFFLDAKEALKYGIIDNIL